jgi:multiple sugar transport system permease protein
MKTKYRIFHYADNLMHYLLLALFVLFSFFPVLLVFLNAFKDPTEIFTYPPRLIFPPTIKNFYLLAKDNPIYFESLRNSVIITLGGVAVSLFCCFTSAFAMSRYKGKIVKYFSLFLISVRMFPSMVITIPLFYAVSAMGLVDKHITMIILNSVFSFSFSSMMMKTFVDDIPVELEEAAMIDGCSKWRAFWRITLPLTAAGISAVGIFAAIGFWNEYTFALIFTSRKARTAPLALTTLQNTELGFSWGVVFAASVIQLLPMMIMVIIIHKYLIKGRQAGALK